MWSFALHTSTGMLVVAVLDTALAVRGAGRALVTAYQLDPVLRRTRRLPASSL